MEQIVDIATDGRHLHRHRGFMVVTADREEVGRVPLDQTLAVIVHAHGVAFSNNLLSALAEQGPPMVFCGPNHSPRVVLWPLDGHHAQGARMRAQWQSKLPLRKQVWKQIVVAKVIMQAAALDAFGAPSEPLAYLARKVRSGDEGNIEAQAARRYWPLMMGDSFRRDTAGGGVNGLLNYGYTVLRAATARAVVAAGLNPTIGIFHTNRGNSFALADDLMEPFRPLVDCAVRGLAGGGVDEVTPDAKRVLARLMAFDLTLGDTRSPVTSVLGRLALSLARSFEAGKPVLALPGVPTAIELSGLGAPP